jgi:hypothetical protein
MYENEPIITIGTPNELVDLKVKEKILERFSVSDPNGQEYRGAIRVLIESGSYIYTVDAEFKEDGYYYLSIPRDCTKIT